jgi:hypothetical protein
MVKCLWDTDLTTSDFLEHTTRLLFAYKTLKEDNERMRKALKKIYKKEYPNSKGIMVE